MAIRAGINIITMKLVHLRPYSAQRRLFCNFCVTIKISAHCFEHRHTRMLHNNIYMSMVYNQCGVKNRHYFFHSFFYLWGIDTSCLSSFEMGWKKRFYTEKKRNLLIYFCVLYGSLALSKMAAPRSTQSSILSMGLRVQMTSTQMVTTLCFSPHCYSWHFFLSLWL